MVRNAEQGRDVPDGTRILGAGIRTPHDRHTRTPITWGLSLPLIGRLLSGLTVKRLRLRNMDFARHRAGCEETAVRGRPDYLVANPCGVLPRPWPCPFRHPVVLVGTHNTIRTCGLPLRRRPLYPAELYGHVGFSVRARPVTTPPATGAGSPDGAVWPGHKQKPGFPRWSRQRDSNPRIQLGKLVRYRLHDACKGEDVDRNGQVLATGGFG